MLSPHSRPYGSETQIDLRAGVPRVTLESEERSKTVDTKSPVTPESSHHRGSQVQAREDFSRYNHPLVAGSKSSVEIFPLQSKLTLQPSSIWKGNKSSGSSRPGPGRESSLPGSLARPPQAQGRMHPLSPTGSHLTWSLGLGGRPGRDF